MKVYYWDRRCDSSIRVLSKKASISRCWFLIAKRFGRISGKLLKRWKIDRQNFISAWENSEKEGYVWGMERALQKGGSAIWKLFRGGPLESTRPLMGENGITVTDRGLIVNHLRSHHKSTLK